LLVLGVCGTSKDVYLFLVSLLSVLLEVKQGKANLAQVVQM
jgi:hypothetical protein